MSGIKLNVVRTTKDKIFDVIFLVLTLSLCFDLLRRGRADWKLPVWGYVALAGLLFAFYKSGLVDPFALVIPLLFVRIIILLKSFFGKGDKQ